MEPGTRVLLHSLSTAKYNGLIGTSIKLDRESLRYIIKVDMGGGKDPQEVSFKLENLQLLDWDEEVDGDMITLAGFNYCAKHRHELCSLW